MYLAPDDAKTDVILASAVVVFGGSLIGFVTGLPFYPRTGLVAGVLDVAWILALTVLVPMLLARYRRDGAAAFGVTGGGWFAGLPLALPAVAVGVAVPWLTPGVRDEVALGRIAAVQPFPGSVVDSVVVLAQVAAFSLGALLLFGFLASRAREGFPRSPELPLKQLVRTGGLVLAAAAAVTGAAGAIGPGGGWVSSLAVAGLNAAAILALVLLVDRRVPFGLTVPRAAVITPLIVVLIAHIFATGGLFRGDLVTGLHTAALGGGVALVIAALAQTRAGVAPAVWLVIAVHWWPTCLSPLSLAGGVC